MEVENSMTSHDPTNVPVTVPEMITSESTLCQLMDVAARRFGHKPLVVALDRTVSFNEMRVLAQRVAMNLLAMGIWPGDRVTLWMENSWQWMAAYFGVLQMGAVVNPVNILLTTEEVAYIAGDCASKLVLTSAKDALLLAQRTGIPVISTGETRSTGREIGSRVFPFETLLNECALDIEAPLSQIDPQAIATIGYTSGTTGHPKGAVLTHASIVTNTLMTALMHGRTRDDIIVTSLPCSHVYGNIVMNSAVTVGA
jgi:long-chain acyl-CoA synthetase